MAAVASSNAGRGPTFLGSYTYQLDGKGRVALPAAFRREAPDQRFVLIQAYAPSLQLYPETEWRGVEDRLRELVRHQPDARMWVLRTMASAVEVAPDAQGRILIPQRLKEAAQLAGEALLVGAIDRIEIWNPQDFERTAEAQAEGFERFASQIFR
ncbi:MAG: division/cell wall cluster transcriptional repressor MraZ [Longimicrobiales bacterium]